MIWAGHRHQVNALDPGLPAATYLCDTDRRAEMSQTILTFNVPEMHCQSCIRAINAAVHQVDPKAEVETDLAARRVTVRGEAGATAYAEAIEAAGFTAMPV
jgi:copper chaperone CopZ